MNPEWLSLLSGRRRGRVVSLFKFQLGKLQIPVKDLQNAAVLYLLGNGLFVPSVNLALCLEREKEREVVQQWRKDLMKYSAWEFCP